MEKGNIIIALFMGMEYTPTKEILLDKTVEPQRAFKFKDLDYHKEWNSLIPVVQKIKEVQFFGTQNLINRIDNVLTKELDKVKLREMCLDFIDYYNKNKKNDTSKRM